MRDEEVWLLPDAFEVTDEECEAAALAGRLAAEAVAGRELHLDMNE